MAIVIRRLPTGYEADLSPPHGDGQPWRSPEPMEIEELISALLARGCHQTDIADAFDEADPEWQFRE